MLDRKVFDLTILGKDYKIEELSIGEAEKLRKIYLWIYNKQLEAGDNIRKISKTNKDFAELAIRLVKKNLGVKTYLLTKRKIYFGMTESEYLNMIMQIAKILGIGTKEDNKKKITA